MTVIQGNYESIIRFCNEKTNGNFFEFSFCYVSKNERFRELDRFLWESKHCMRFQNEYIGNVVIDLTAWNGCKEYEFNEYFDAFFYYLKSKSDRIQPLLIVNGKCSTELYKCLRKFYNIRVTELGKGEVPLKNEHVTIGFRESGE